MASTSKIHLAFENFHYVIESITPDSVVSTNLFSRIDPVRVSDGGDSSGWTRRFAVYWDGSGSDLTGPSGATDMNHREAVHEFVVEVYYPTGMPYADLMEMILQDRHQLRKELRAQGNRAGSSASETTSEHIFTRICSGDEIDRRTDPNVWRLRIGWRCHIREDEI